MVVWVVREVVASAIVDHLHGRLLDLDVRGRACFHGVLSGTLSRSHR